jgi:hypothetical protein
MVRIAAWGRYVKMNIEVVTLTAVEIVGISFDMRGLHKSRCDA